jgi:eukaryotic-like serine/threonine-protein kinase
MTIPARYKEIGKPLHGGMGVVLHCQDTILERSVAIKIMPGSANNRRAVDELSALLKIRSKHVVQVYDLFRLDNDDLAIVQEFISGKDLFDPELAPKTQNEFLKLIWQIAVGIADIHSLDIIHRDIKPNNMKIDTESVIKIFDFGLAREEGPNAATLGFVGTRGFAAPELHPQHHVQHHVQFTTAVDTYAFGATALYVGLQDLPGELKQWPPTFSGQQYFDLLPFDLADEVKAVLYACLHPNPVERPTMQAIRDLLAKHLLHDKHRALIVHQGRASYLDATNRAVQLNSQLGKVTIEYDGFNFCVKQVNGDVFINNQRTEINAVLPGACVVTLGAPENKNSRVYVTFDLSHPEIVL